MKVKRYEGKSEAALMPIIHEEMGANATIISVKEKPSTGFFSFLRSPTVVITAACEDDTEFLDIMAKAEAEEKTQYDAPHVERKPISADLVESNSTSIEESMTLLLQEARKAANQIEHEESAKRSNKSQIAPATATVPTQAASEMQYKHSMVQLFYDTMISQEVLPDVAEYILKDFEHVDESGDLGANIADARLLYKWIRGRIIDILKDPPLINTNRSD